MRQEKYEVTGSRNVMSYPNDENERKAGAPDSVTDPACPGEAEILAYCEGWIEEDRCRQLDKHFAECEACIELLAVFALIASPQDGAREESAAVSAENRRQAEKIAELIEQDEGRFS